LSPITARQLAIDTAVGAAELARSSAFEPAELRRQVTSKGGTTEQALNLLMQGDFERIVTEAVAAAARRAGELSKEFGGD
jgi:pyrroline-5-carboxylate reductase